MAQVARPSKGRLARLAKLAELRDQGEDEHLASAEFKPEGRKAGSDYNLHYLDVNPPADAEAEFSRLARKLMG